MHELRVRDGAPVRRGRTDHHVHELRVRDGLPVRRGRTGHHVHELRGAMRQSGEAGQATMCWGVGGGAPVRRGRSGHHVLGGGGAPVSLSCA